MVIKVSVSEAKARLSSLIAEVAAGRQVLVERDGEVVAAIVSPQDLKAIERERPAAQPRGALVLIGAWSEIEDHEADELLAQIYARRSKAAGRSVELER